MTEVSEEKTTSDQPNAFARGIKVIAYPVSGAIAWIFGQSKSRHESYGNIKNAGAFTEGRNRRNNEIAEILNSHDKTDVAQKLSDAEKRYSKYVDKRFAEIGLSGRWARFKSLHPIQKMETGLTAFTAAGISLGVLLTIADSKSLLSKLNVSDRDKDTSR